MKSLDHLNAARAAKSREEAIEHLFESALAMVREDSRLPRQHAEFEEALDYLKQAIVSPDPAHCMALADAFSTGWFGRQSVEQD